MKKLLLGTLLCLMLPAAASAQIDEENLGKAQDMLTAQVKEVYWEVARGYNGEKLTAPEGQQDEIYKISPEEEKLVILGGMNAAKFEWCGLDVEAYVKSFMKRQKDRGMWSVYQLAYIALLESSAQGFTKVALGKQTCNDAVKKEVQQGYKEAIEQWEKDAKHDVRKEKAKKQ